MVGPLKKDFFCGFPYHLNIDMEEMKGSVLAVDTVGSRMVAALLRSRSTPIQMEYFNILLTVWRFSYELSNFSCIRYNENINNSLKERKIVGYNLCLSISTAIQMKYFKILLNKWRFSYKLSFSRKKIGGQKQDQI